MSAIGQVLILVRAALTHLPRVFLTHSLLLAVEPSPHVITGILRILLGCLAEVFDTAFGVGDSTFFFIVQVGAAVGTDDAVAARVE